MLSKPQSSKGRFLWVIGGGLVLLFVFAIAFSLLLGGGGSTDKLLVIAQDQTEIARVSALGVTKSRDIATRNFAQTVASTMTTSQQQTVAYLSSHKSKPAAKELVMGKSTKTDASLAAAEAAGRYDQELLTILEKALANYRTKVNEAYTATDSKSQKQLLEQFFNQVNLLIKNQPATSS